MTSNIPIILFLPLRVPRLRAQKGIYFPGSLAEWETHPRQLRVDASGPAIARQWPCLNGDSRPAVEISDGGRGLLGAGIYISAEDMV